MSDQTNITFKKKLEGASSIDTRPSRKMLTPDKLHVKSDTQYEKDESISELMRQVLVKQPWQKRVS